MPSARTAAAFKASVRRTPPAAAAGAVRLTLALNAAAVLALGILPGPLLNLCARLIH